MTLAAVCRTLATSTAVASIAVGAFLSANVVMAKSVAANGDVLAVLQQKAEAGDPAAQFSLGLKLALSSRL